MLYVKGYSCPEQVISELRDVTCSVTCYPTQVNSSRLIPATHNRFTYHGGMEGWVDQGGWLVVIYRDGLPVSRQSPIQVVTGPNVEQLRRSRPTC